MAVAWVINDYGKLKIGNATIDLSDNALFRLALYTSGATALISTGDISIQSSLLVANEATGANYTAGGTQLTGITWTQAAGTATFDATAVIMTGSIAAVKYAAIIASAGATTSGHILATSELSTTNFAVASGNTLTITPNASGIFTLT